MDNLAAGLDDLGDGELDDELEAQIAAELDEEGLIELDSEEDVSDGSAVVVGAKKDSDSPTGSSASGIGGDP